MEKREVNGPTQSATPTPSTSQPTTENPTTSEQSTTPSNITTETDHHDYYRSTILSDPTGFYWDELHGHTRHILSNDHHLKYSFVSASFNFSFYGHLINRFAITTQGFLYMSSFTHPNLDFSHSRYIAPLMGNFDTIGNDSEILYKDNGTSFVVEWRHVKLNDQEENGYYTFQTSLFENGTILFAYKSIPETSISGKIWPVKIGIADAFYYDRRDPRGIWIRYIVRYHVIEVNVTKLTDNTAIVLEPLPTCNKATTCTECTTSNIGFNCSWCHSVGRCSDGLDWHRQEWLDTECDTTAIDSPDLCMVTTETSSNTNSESTESTLSNFDITTSSSRESGMGSSSSTESSISYSKTTESSISSSESTESTLSNFEPTVSTTSNSESTIFISTTSPQGITRSKESRTDEETKSASIVIVPIMIVLLLIIIVFIGAWIFYARSHPTLDRDNC